MVSAGAAAGTSTSSGRTSTRALVCEEAHTASIGEAPVGHLKLQRQPTLMDGGIDEGSMHDGLDVAMTRSQHRTLASSVTVLGDSIEALQPGESDDLASVSARLAVMQDQQVSMASKQESLARAVADQDDKLTRILALLSRSGV